MFLVQKYFLKAKKLIIFLFIISIVNAESMQLNYQFFQGNTITGNSKYVYSNIHNNLFSVKVTTNYYRYENNFFQHLLYLKEDRTTIKPLLYFQLNNDNNQELLLFTDNVTQTKLYNDLLVIIELTFCLNNNLPLPLYQLVDNNNLLHQLNPTKKQLKDSVEIHYKRGNVLHKSFVFKKINEKFILFQEKISENKEAKSMELLNSINY